LLNIIINYFTANHCAELIGTMSNILIITSYCLHGEKKIRTFCILSSLISVVYNYLVHATSFMILCMLLILVNLYYLFFVKLDS